MPETKPTQVLTITRLNPALYAKLEQKFSRPIVLSTTTAHEAGFQLGVQAVLQELRNGYTTEV